MAARWMTWVGLCCSNRALVSAAFLGWEILGFSTVEGADGGVPKQKPTRSTHVKSASLEDTKIHSSSGRPSPSATTFSMALPTKPVPPVTRMRLGTSPAASVMAKTLRGMGGVLSCGHLRVHPATDHRAHPHPGIGTHEYQP